MEDSTDPIPIDATGVPLSPSPRSIGRYALRFLLGRGAEGSVYEAVDPLLARRVALKVYEGTNSVHANRLLRGARLAGQLTHLNIVSTYDFVYEKGCSAIVQELLDGDSLNKVIPRAAAPTLSALRSIAQAMAYAHERGIVHRDLKLENVFACSSGTLKVLDFGLAKDISELSVMTIPATDPNRVGTPLYMAPEVYAGEAPTRSVDIWSFGVLAFRLVHGRFPFQPKSLVELIDTVRTGPIPSMKAIDAPDGWPDEAYGRVAALVDDCLRRSPHERRPFTDLCTGLEAIIAALLAG
jgi:serine/threonine protein kinase